MPSGSDFTELGELSFCFLFRRAEGNAQVLFQEVAREDDVKVGLADTAPSTARSSQTAAYERAQSTLRSPFSFPFQPRGSWGSSPAPDSPRA